MNIALSAQLLEMLGKPSFIIDTTNSPKSKAAALRYGKSNGISMISASSDTDRAEMCFIKPGDDYQMALFQDYEGAKQGNITSGVIGGIIAEELKKFVMPLPDSDTVVKKIGYSLACSKRFSSEIEYRGTRSDLRNKRILVVGAGALGNFVALEAALEGIGRIDVLDSDAVDSTNLNRQILFYNSVGKMKATALAEKISEVAASAAVTGIVGKLDEHSDYFEKNKPDAILDCVDSFASRAIINYFAVKNGIPLISGGTDSGSGQVVVYVPGKSACLDCKLGVETALAEQRKESSCKYAPNPSVIMTNQIIGSMMVGEMIKTLDEQYGEPIRRILKYEASAPARGGLIGTADACGCKKPDIQEWLNQIDNKLNS